MEQQTAQYTPAEKRSQPGPLLDNFHSVQFSLHDMGPIYLFKLRNIPLNGLGILVKEDSPVLKELEVGDIVDMEYNMPGLSGSSERLKTRVSSKNCHDCFTGHTLIGLSIVGT